MRLLRRLLVIYGLSDRKNGKNDTGQTDGRTRRLLKSFFLGQVGFGLKSKHILTTLLTACSDV